MTPLASILSVENIVVYVNQCDHGSGNAGLAAKEVA
jgi:hypothetical protein